MADTTLPLLGAGGAVAAGDLFISRQGADTVDKRVTGTQLKTFMAQTTSGTLNRISVASGGTNPVVDIDAAYAGQSSITTLGTITSGSIDGGTP